MPNNDRTGELMDALYNMAAVCAEPGDALRRLNRLSNAILEQARADARGEAVRVLSEARGEDGRA